MKAKHIGIAAGAAIGTAIALPIGGIGIAALGTAVGIPAAIVALTGTTVGTKTGYEIGKCLTPKKKFFWER